jgi:hypothetical protein
MRRLALTLALAAAAAAIPATAPAADAPFLRAAPRPVHFGETLVIKGRAWPVIEFCRRNVRLALRTEQNEFLIGFQRIRDSGRFRREFVPRRSRIGAGRWTLVARLRCESGKDGSANFIRRRLKVRILGWAAPGARRAGRLTRVAATFRPGPRCRRRAPRRVAPGVRG